MSGASTLRILVTGARAPVALELTRALGAAGHTVFAADSLTPTLAGSSRYAAGRVRLPPPRFEPRGFVAALGEAVARLGIDLVIPTCEEVFYVAMAHSATSARLFCEPLADLAGWHHKAAFQRRAAALGLTTPRTATAHSRAELLALLPDFPRYLLKPAYSRFATEVITNCGPYAALRSLDACRPTPERPWLVQEYIVGEAVCSYSVLHRGHVTAHCAYTTPHTAGLGAGTAFVGVEGLPSLEVVRTLGVTSGYTGQLSLDFLKTSSGALYLLECNPRTTSGAHLIRRDRLVTALLEPSCSTWVEPPGRRRQVSAATLALALRGGGWRALANAMHTPDVILADGDPLPALTQLVQVARFAVLSQRKGLGLLAATTDDIEWNGDADLHP